MANPQPENGFVKLANEIWNEIIRRDFSKRQKDIILFIWRLSYGCQKKFAVIPKLKDFELCGIGAQNITNELKYLASTKVIFWEKSESVFIVNKDYEQWQISPVRGWDEEKFKELIHLNLEKKTSQNKKLSPEKKLVNIIITSQNKKLKLLKTRSRYFLKQEVRLPSNPCRCKVKRVSKDSIKYIIKKRTTTSTTTSSKNAHDFSYSKIFQTYSDNFAVDSKVNQFDVDEINTLFDDYGGEWLLLAMREAYRHNIRTLAYIHGILKGYKSRGGPETEKQPEGNGNTTEMSTQKPTVKAKHNQAIDMLDQIEREEREREQSGSYSTL
ncbi:replication protein [Paenibacillus sp. HWE-109]|uniref:replication protein n=1 Tax=Paenibacillus sp. HWE-109 TaxID=1306526 RepID=UPI001EDDFC89|nr:replication protein [Paenibacillus sp. HWE-109]UKS27181.1 replication protein [Paenibacillus sp. HWE-109]